MAGLSDMRYGKAESAGAVHKLSEIIHGDKG